MENIKSKYNNNKCKISAPTWNYNFDLLDGFYSIADIQDYFELIIKKHETLTENPPIQIDSNKIKNRIVFKIKTSTKISSTKKDVDADENSKNVPKIESVEVVLVYCHLVKKNYEHIQKFCLVNKYFTTFFNNDEYS